MPQLTPRVLSFLVQKLTTRESPQPRSLGRWRPHRLCTARGCAGRPIKLPVHMRWRKAGFDDSTVAYVVRSSGNLAGMNAEFGRQKFPDSREDYYTVVRYSRLLEVSEWRRASRHRSSSAVRSGARDEARCSAISARLAKGSTARASCLLRWPNPCLYR